MYVMETRKLMQEVEKPIDRKRQRYREEDERNEG